MADDAPDFDSLFCRAIELPSAEDRAAFIARASGTDDGLRRRLERLVEAHFQAGSFLGSPTATVDPVPTGEPESQRVGPYKLLERIGEGGMGTVYLAEQVDPVRRTVALKLIKAGMDSRQVLARFEVERQALALMDHPNIAKVLDAGTAHDGRPYFVMELVRGIPITRFCDERRLTPRGRLELFIPVCQAVQHAHQKGIIHRDLKPSNVLVGLYDGVPVPKVIDFGVAKATGQKLTEATLFTGFGVVVGTPEYMSPEQAQLENLDIDTRSDVYSLGALLYELLTGSTPLDRRRLNQAGILEVLRVIREEEPPRPSLRLSTTEELASVAATRGVEPRRLTGLVRGELDWIVMKAIDKDRSRRYATANGLADDLRRHLEDEPVQASPPSAWYRLRKLARRNRAALATATLVLAAVLLGTVVSVGQAIRATRSGRLARENAQRARRAVDDMYTQVAERWLVDQPQLEPLQREFLQKALKFYEEFTREAGDDADGRRGLAEAYRRLGEIHHKLNEPGPAESAFNRAIDHFRSLSREFPDVPGHQQSLADALCKLATVHEETGRRSAAGEVKGRAVEILERLVAASPGVPEYRRDLGRATGDLTLQRRLADEFPAVHEYREDVANTLLGLSHQLGEEGRRLDQRRALRDASETFGRLAAESPSVARYRNQLAYAYSWLGRVSPPPEGERFLTEALAIQEKLVADFPTVAYFRYDLVRSLHTLGSTRHREGRAPEAVAALRRALAIGERLAVDAPAVSYYRGRLAAIHAGLADVLRETRRLPEAEASYRRSVALSEQIFAETADVVNKPRQQTPACFALASILADSGRPRESAEFYRKGLAVDPRDANGQNELAMHLVTYADHRFRDPRLAVELAGRALKLQPANGNFWNTLGIARYRDGDLEGAVTALRKSMELRGGGDSEDWFFLAMARWRLGDRDEALRLYDRAVAWMVENAPRGGLYQSYRDEAAELLGLADPMPDGEEAFARP